MKNTVYIYAGENTGSSVARMMHRNFSHAFGRNGLTTRLITAAGILKGSWTGNAHTLIWGGGESTAVRKVLNTGGIFRKDIIKAAHESGVHFAGYCGGGFLGYDHITFEGADGYKRQGEGFGLYPRRSNGAPVGLTPKNFTGMSDSATILSLRHHATGRYFHSLYCCGPYFPAYDLPESAKPLATAKHPVTGQEYILGVQMPAEKNCGSVTLYGYHPDYLADFINFRTREVPSIASEDKRLRAEAHKARHGILLGFNLMLYDLKTAMGLMPDKPQPLIIPQLQLA